MKYTEFVQMVNNPPSGGETAEIIQAVANGDVKGIVGENIKKAADKYGIPYRTLQNWMLGQRSAPDYVIKMLGFAALSEIESESLKTWQGLTKSAKKL